MGLNEVFSAALQAAAAKGSELLRKPVEIAMKGAGQAGWDSPALKGHTLMIPTALSQDVNGGGALLLDARYAALMAELMFENDPASLPTELTELQLTAASEALSQICAALGDGLSRATRRRVMTTAGEPVQIPGGDSAAAARGTVREERVVVVDGEMTIGAHPPSRLALVVPASVGDALLSDKPGAGAGSPEVTLGAAQTGAGGVRVQPAQFGSFGSAGPDAPSTGNLDLLLDVPLEITVELGRANRRVRDVLSLGPGSIVELSKLAGEPVDLLVNGKPIAKGEVVVIDENFAVRIIEIMAREERLAGGL